MTSFSTSVSLETKILTVRGQKVMLDSDLALVYGVETKNLNKAVSRNAKRFPSVFAFRLNSQEVAHLRFQIGTSNIGRGGRRYLPYVFTEHGAVMAANILRTRQAEEMSVFVVRAFVKMREQLLSRAELEARLAHIETVLLAHDEHIRELYDKIRPLLLPPPDPPKKQTGFGVREPGVKYVPRKKRTTP